MHTQKYIYIIHVFIYLYIVYIKSLQLANFVYMKNSHEKLELLTYNTVYKIYQSRREPDSVWCNSVELGLQICVPGYVLFPELCLNRIIPTTKRL